MKLLSLNGENERRKCKIFFKAMQIVRETDLNMHL